MNILRNAQIDSAAIAPHLGQLVERRALRNFGGQEFVHILFQHLGDFFGQLWRQVGILAPAIDAAAENAAGFGSDDFSHGILFAAGFQQRA